jgi:hypothetical protein
MNRSVVCYCLVAFVLAAWPVPGTAENVSCARALGAPAVTVGPLGTMPVAGVSGLPDWDPTQRAAYRKVIDAAVMRLSDSRTQRLEGVIPYVGKNGGVGYGTVRLF